MTAKDIFLNAYRTSHDGVKCRVIRFGWLVKNIIAYEIIEESGHFGDPVFKVKVARKDRKDRCRFLSELTKYKKKIDQAEKYISFLRQSGCKR